MPDAAALPLDALFRAFSTVAFAGWLALAFLPRWPWLRTLLKALVVGLLCPSYALLIAWSFGQPPAEGAGFSTLAELQRLFSSPMAALAGWLHYLAFDLFVGRWIARRADETGMPRWAQAPILALTLMLGPLGLLAFALAQAARGRARAHPTGPRRL